MIPPFLSRERIVASPESFTWIWVGVPFAYGLYQLIAKLPALFAG